MALTETGNLGITPNYCEPHSASSQSEPTAGTNAEISYSKTRVGARARVLRRGRASRAGSTASSNSAP
eukprot:305229-Pleurochrysis_carterae.AAC.1